MNVERYNRVIVWSMQATLLMLGVYSFLRNSAYLNDFFILSGFLWLVYLARDRLRLHPVHFGMFGVFLLLHNFGVFGFYSMHFAGIEYDWYVHTFFGLVAGLMLSRTYTLRGPYTGTMKVAAVVALVLGFSALTAVEVHTDLGGLLTFAGAMLFGQGEGVLLIGAGDLDPWDTQKDMLNNLVGGLLGMGLYRIRSFWNRN